jgi:predicted glycosyltransferase
VSFLVRDYGETRRLVDETGLPCWFYSRPPQGRIAKLFGVPQDVARAWRRLRHDKPDVLAGFGVYEAFVGRLLGRPAVSFTDSEPSCNSRGFLLQYKSYIPFLSALVTPVWFKDDLGRKQVRVASLKELAYLRHRVPTAAPPAALGLAPGERYAIVRINAFDAVHDLGIRGFHPEEIRALVERLERQGKVFVSVEGRPIPGLEGRALPTAKSEIHAVLEHASLLVTDTQTMATEAVLLGTPTVRCNGFVGERDMGIFQRLESDYGMLDNFRDPVQAAARAVELFGSPRAKEDAQRKARDFLAASTDIVPWMADLLVATGKAGQVPPAYVKGVE